MSLFSIIHCDLKMKWFSCILLVLPALISVSRAADEDVLDLSENTVDSFKSAVGQHDAVLVEFCEY